MPCSGCPKCEPPIIEETTTMDHPFFSEEPATKPIPTKGELPVKNYEAVLDIPFTFSRVVLSWNPPYLPKLVFYRKQENGGSAGPDAAHVTLGPVDAETPRMLDLNELGKLCYENAKEHGFYDPPPTLENRLILIVSEVTEILEEHRDGRAPTDVRYSANRGTDFNTQKPEGIPSEFADVIIRCLDACAYYGIDIHKAVLEKMAYNKSRPHKHGRTY